MVTPTKMKKLYSSLLMLSVLLLASCEKEIEFNGDITQPLVVVNSYLLPDSTVRVQLSKSRFFLDSKVDYDRIDDATVTIVVNNNFSEALRHTQYGNYIGSYLPQPGDSVALSIKVPGEDEIVSSAVIPPPSTVISIDTLSRRQISRYPAEVRNDTIRAWMIDYELEMGLRIKDPAIQKNYYRLSILYNEEYADWDYRNYYYVYFTLQGVSNENSGDNLLGLIGGEQQKEFHLFPDDLFDGKDIVIRFKVKEYVLERAPGYTDPNPPAQISYIVNLQSLNRDTYLFLKTKEASKEIVNEFFSEPVQIFSNITNGIGIFGAITNNRKVLKMSR